jgi:glycosyltransferase involved in cell wall biosynthesis
VLPNAFTIPIGEERKKRRCESGSTLVIGHLSNLSRSKGIDIVVELYDMLVDRGAIVSGLWSGPISEVNIGKRMVFARERADGYTRYVGGVYGDAKVKFFGAIDVFVFPSRYVNEAQPLVLIEALAHGCPVATVARGCTTCDQGGSESFVAARELAFLDDTSEWCAALARSPRALCRAVIASRTRAMQNSADARGAFAAWLAAIASSGRGGKSQQALQIIATTP